MEKWFSEHWLALYGSLVGTLALFLNFSNLVHTINKEKVKLKINIEDHPEKEKNINRITKQSSNNNFDIPSLVETHIIKVRNIGNVDAYIEDAWIICSKGVKHKALIYQDNPPHHLIKVSEARTYKIKPKESTELKIFLHRNEEIFHASKGVVCDSSGKNWKIKAS